MGRGVETGSEGGEEKMREVDNMDPTRSLEPMSLPEKARLIKVQRLIKDTYPGAAGEILATYVEEWKEFGYRLGSNALLSRFLGEVKASAELSGDIKPDDEWVEIP